MKFTNSFTQLRYLFSLSLILGLFVALSSCEQAPPPNSKPAQIKRGQALFQKYCFSCHGNHGDGIVADTLKTKPLDLTKIVKRRNMQTFPIKEIARYIDGRNDVKAHGSREMPVWGEDLKLLENIDSEDQLRGKMGELISYLMSIQD